MKNSMIYLACCAALVLLTSCATAGSQGGDITGAIWVLENLNGQPPLADTLITATFTADGKVGGTTGCNQYTGQYTVSGSSIQIQTGALTMMACAQPIMDQEAAYIQALGSAKTFEVKGEQLVLKDSSGKAVATYKAQSQGLAGSSWEVTAYNNGKQAVTSVLTGTTLSAMFGEDGSLSGNSGCNSYSGSYKTDGNKIEIGPLASTRMMCSEPEGVMEQEAQFLAAMQSAATYSIVGPRLEFRTADDAKAVDFVRK